VLFSRKAVGSPGNVTSDNRGGGTVTSAPVNARPRQSHRQYPGNNLLPIPNQQMKQTDRSLIKVNNCIEQKEYPEVILKHIGSTVAVQAGNTPEPKTATGQHTQYKPLSVI
jgi:hypothetical protein